jgi:hypothetical protein
VLLAHKRQVAGRVTTVSHNSLMNATLRKAGKRRTPGDRRRASSMGKSWCQKEEGRVGACAGRGLPTGSEARTGPQHRAHGPRRPRPASLRPAPSSVRPPPCSAGRTTPPGQLARDLQNFFCGKGEKKSGTPLGGEGCRPQGRRWQTPTGGGRGTAAQGEGRRSSRSDQPRESGRTATPADWSVGTQNRSRGLLGIPGGSLGEGNRAPPEGLHGGVTDIPLPKHAPCQTQYPYTAAACRLVRNRPRHRELSQVGIFWTEMGAWVRRVQQDGGICKVCRAVVKRSW